MITEGQTEEHFALDVGKLYYLLGVRVDGMIGYAMKDADGPGCLL